jgi:hypothetical protein
VEIFLAKILKFPNSKPEAELLSSDESVNAAPVVQLMARIGMKQSELAENRRKDLIQGQER